MNNVKQYLNIQVMTADRVRLIILLYDGIIRFNKFAQAAVAGGDVEGRTNYINRSLAIVSELQNSLNMEEGGEVAKNLFRLYDFCSSQLMSANINKDPSRIESVNRVINELRSGWEAIANDKSAQAEPLQQRRISCGI